MENKRILVTGASSFLGSTLVEKLVGTYDVTVLEHRQKVKQLSGVHVIHGGLENIGEWQETLAQIDIVMHLAGVTHSRDVQAYEDINHIGTRNLIQASVAHHVRQFLFVSTRAVSRNCGAYGESKLRAENELKKSMLNYSIFRVAESYDDSYSSREGIGSLAKLVAHSGIIPYIPDKEVTLAPIHRDDVVEALIQATHNPRAYQATYTLAGPETLGMKEVVTRIAQSMHVRRVLLPIPLSLVRSIFFLLTQSRLATPDQLQRLTCRKEALSENVQRDLGVQPRKFQENS